MSNAQDRRQAMIKVDPNIGQRIADQLFASEEHIDRSLASQARMASEIVEGRMAANLSAGFVQDLLQDAIDALNATVEARRKTIDLHRSMAKMQDRVGLGAIAYGPFTDKAKTKGNLVEVPRVA